MLVLTFDDGYMDNLTNALPIMEQYNAPGTVFCATGLMTGEIISYWDFLEECILSCDIVTAVDGTSIPVRTMEEKETAFLSIRQELLPLSANDIENYFIRLGYSIEDLKSKSKNEMIPLEVLSNYNESKIISFGSHTYSHLSCGMVSEKEFSGELVHSLQLLNSHSVKVKHFAYPYGNDVMEKDKFRDIFQQNSIQTCCTTFSGFVSQNSSPLFLPRLFVTEYDSFSLKKNLFQVQLQLLKQKIMSKL